MNIEELTKQKPRRDTALTIGVFDGVHLGHRQLVERVKEEAERQKLLTCVVTFEDHPQHVLSPGIAVTYLTTREEKVSLLRQLGMDLVVVLPFTRELAQLTARQFVDLLKKQLRMCTLVIGPDFALGRGREGDAAYLRTLAPEMGFTLIALPPVTINGEVVSSTAIRAALARGELSRVNSMLGRPFSIGGKVESGAERGRTMGYPTANISVEPGKAMPLDGVYVTLAHVSGRTYPSVTNVGPCPTFGATRCSVEVHVLDFQGDLYGQELRIELLERLRGEVRFASAEELKAQIAHDVEQARAILGVRK